MRSPVFASLRVTWTTSLLVAWTLAGCLQTSVEVDALPEAGPASPDVEGEADPGGGPSAEVAEDVAGDLPPAETPCLAVNPEAVDFGGKLAGQLALMEVEITNCGSLPQTMSGATVTGSAEFALAAGVADSLPRKLEPGETSTVAVAFLPLVALEGEGHQAPSQGTLTIEVEEGEDLLVPLSGYGIAAECPTATIKVEEGEKMVPQNKKIQLLGSQSFGPHAISKYEWTAKRPPGSSQSGFVPSPSAPDPVFYPDVMGTYAFELRVWDENGQPSCETAEVEVLVLPDAAIHIELLWHTPGDPDDDDIGADVDLHLLHPSAEEVELLWDGIRGAGKYFDPVYDCYWWNSKPDWGSPEPFVGDPMLSHQDSAAAGPEILHLDIPEDGTQYRLGVHYWTDQGYGASLVNVRVYVLSVLVFEVKDVELERGELWEVATIDWPSGTVTPLTNDAGGYVIDYIGGAF